MAWQRVGTTWQNNNHNNHNNRKQCTQRQENLHTANFQGRGWKRIFFFKIAASASLPTPKEVEAAIFEKKCVSSLGLENLLAVGDTSLDLSETIWGLGVTYLDLSEAMSGDLLLR